MKETTKQVLVAGGVAAGAVYGGLATQVETTFPAMQEHGATPYYGGAAAAAAGAWYFWKKKPMVAAALAGLGLAAAYEGFQRSSAPAPTGPQATPQLGGTVAPALPAPQTVPTATPEQQAAVFKGNQYSGSTGLTDQSTSSSPILTSWMGERPAPVQAVQTESGDYTWTSSEPSQSAPVVAPVEEEPGFFDRLSDWWSDEDGGAVMRPRGRRGLGGGFGGLMG